MTPQELQSFADNYTAKDFERISIQLQGKNGQELRDKNNDFRIQVCEFLIPQLQQAKLELLKDLYLEEGKVSEYTFACYRNFHLIGQELLERGGTAYLTIYLRGAANTMDTALVSGRISLSKAKAKELLIYFDNKMKNPDSREEEKLYCDYFRARFEREVNK